MIIICPHCQMKHKIDEKQIPSDVNSVHCKVCGKSFNFSPEEITHDEDFEKQQSEKRARKIGVLMSKGGVGKTTTAVNLSAGLALAGRRVLLVDTDIQGQASYMLGIKPETGLIELMTNELTPEEAITEARERLWLLGGGRSLAGVKRLIESKDFNGEMLISESLTSIQHLFDFIILDTSPGWNSLTVSVLFYIEEILLPISLDAMALHGLIEFLNNISTLRKNYKKFILKYILPTFLDNRTKKPNELLKQLEHNYQDSICKPIRYNIKLSEAPAFGQTIYEYAPDATGAQDYKELIKKVSGNMNLFKI